VNIIYRQDLAKADDADARRRELTEHYRDTFANPFRAAELGYVDEVIHPRETRRKLIRGLDMLQDKVDTNPPRKHGNIPL
jgi:propionyl-CoA carboxylase beta chain